MKLKKIFLILVSAIITSSLFVNINISNAATNTLYVGLSRIIPGTTNGYAINDPTVASGEGKTIWNLVSYKSKTGSEYYDYSKSNLYCLKAGAGFYDANGNSSVEERKEYTALCDLREKSVMSNSTHTYVKELANSNYYYKVLYIVDNLYIKGKSNKSDIEALLAKAGIEKIDDRYYYISEGEYDYSDRYVYYGDLTHDGYSCILTEDDMMAVQQAALWHFVNNGTAYDQYNSTGHWLKYTKDSGTKYDSMQGTNGTELEQRAEQAVILYHYLIDSAEKNANNYDETTNSLSKPITTNSKSVLNTKVIGDNCIAGPIKLDKNNDLPYEINLNITDSKSNKITKYSFVDDKGNALKETKISDLIGKEFYISIPNNLSGKININVNIKYKQKTATIYVDNTTNVDQPILVPNIEEKEYDLPFVIGQFDLALRKYITKVDGIELQNESSRVPNIDTENTLDKNEETAKYSHKKDPVQVKTGSIVTYNITIYNEGNKDGYATEVTDQLPTGLKSNLKTGDVVTSSKGNKYIVTYNEETNKVHMKQ